MSHLYQIYKGPSAFNKQPIVALLKDGGNRKLGKDVWQLWILPADRPPHKAITTGHDQSICGNCIHRGKREPERSCYVFVGQGPRKIYERWHKGDFRRGFPSAVPIPFLRLGAYGDPAMLPLHVVAGLVALSSAHLGYTHQWRWCDHRFSKYCMASVETYQEMTDALALGWRTFRVKGHMDKLYSNEVHCPHQTHGTLCQHCKLCGGTATPSQKNIAINVHGFAYKIKNFTQKKLAL
jgi:hypothetical protein